MARSSGPSKARALVASLVLPVLALLIQTVFWQVIKPFAWFLFYPTVFIAPWIGGLRAGIAATLVSTALAWWAFIPPHGTLLHKEPRYLLSIGVFLAMGMAFSLLQHRLRKANQQTLHALAAARLANQGLEQANHEVTRLYDKTRELDELKNHFFASVSHELRTPLTLILGPSERMLTSPDVNGEVRRVFSVIARNARTLLRHVNDLLDVSKLDAAQVVPSYSTEDIAALVRLEAGQFELLAMERKIDLDLQTPASLVVETDPAMLRRVLLNLLSNAFKFTPSGGKVRVSTRSEEGRLLLEVADSGPGIPAEKRELVFERFRQLDGGSTRRFGGTGLGLAIARELVSLLGGEITLGDAPEGGRASS